MLVRKIIKRHFGIQDDWSDYKAKAFSFEDLEKVFNLAQGGKGVTSIALAESTLSPHMAWWFNLGDKETEDILSQLGADVPLDEDEIKDLYKSYCLSIGLFN